MSTPRMSPEEWRLAADMSRELRRRATDRDGHHAPRDGISPDDLEAIWAQRETVEHEDDPETARQNLMSLRAGLMSRDAGFADLISMLCDLDGVPPSPMALPEDDT